MRQAFVNQITELAIQDKNIVLLTADLGFMVFDDFAQKFPKQFFNVGIAESNMIGVATGLAMNGKKVFAYSISNFTVFRPFEQIRNDICHHNVPVTLVGSGAGLSYSYDGLTHYGLEDITLMRSLPNMTIICPADAVEVGWAVKKAVSLQSPVYIRIGKRGEPVINKSASHLKIGKGVWLKEGNDFVIIATGNMVFNALEAAAKLEAQGLRGGVVNFHTIKPLDRKLLEQLACETKFLITIEEHVIYGGLGSAVAEVISQIPNRQAQLLILGVKDHSLHKVGSQMYLRHILGLSPDKISSAIRKFVRGKK